MIRYTGETIGTITIRQEYVGMSKTVRLQIRRGNCLAVIIHAGKDSDTLYNFFVDERHMENIIKNDGALLSDDVVSIKLNMYYKESYKLLKYFVIEGHKVQCYYKPEKVKSKK